MISLCLFDITFGLFVFFHLTATMWDTPKDHLTMMQIDCEVTNTRTISVPDFRNAVTQNGTKTATPPRHTPKEAATSNHSSPPSAASQSTSGHFKAIPPPHRKSLPPHIKKFRAGKKYSVKSNVTKTWWSNSRETSSKCSHNFNCFLLLMFVRTIWFLFHLFFWFR